MPSNVGQTGLLQYSGREFGVNDGDYIIYEMRWGGLIPINKMNPHDFADQYEPEQSKWDRDWNDQFGWGKASQRTEWVVLVLSRKRGESIVINNDITITVVEIRGDKVRLGVEAPTEVPVHRQEVYDAIHRSNEPEA